MRTGRGLIIALVIAVASAIGYGYATAGHGCPGKITCPVTGQPICQDRCPQR